MDEITFDEEELKRLIKEELEKTQTVEEALEEKSKEEALIDESFDNAWNNYHAVATIRHEAIKNLNKAKIRVVVVNFISAIINNGVNDELDHIVRFINEATKELKNQSTIMNKINIALEKLQAHRVAACNYDICELLSYLYDKDDAIYHRVVDEIVRASIRIRGISTMYDDKHDVKIDELNEKISNMTLRLGLDK